MRMGIFKSLYRSFILKKDQPNVQFVPPEAEEINKPTLQHTLEEFQDCADLGHRFLCHSQLYHECVHTLNPFWTYHFSRGLRQFWIAGGHRYGADPSCKFNQSGDLVCYACRSHVRFRLERCIYPGSLLDD